MSVTASSQTKPPLPRCGSKIDVVNRPKNIGTAAETAVRRAVGAFYPDARRVVLHGREDEGDLHALMNPSGEPAIVIEVKGGAQANQPSDHQVDLWLAEAEREREAAGGQIAILVTQRRGVGAPNADRWWAWLRISTLHRISGREDDSAVAAIRMQLGDLLELLYAERWVPRATP